MTKKVMLWELAQIVMHNVGVADADTQRFIFAHGNFTIISNHFLYFFYIANDC